MSQPPNGLTIGSVVFALQLIRVPNTDRLIDTQTTLRATSVATGCIYALRITDISRSSATAEGPREALCQLKSRQLLHSRTKNHTEGHPMSSELPLFDTPYTALY